MMDNWAKMNQLKKVRYANLVQNILPFIQKLNIQGSFSPQNHSRGCTYDLSESVQGIPKKVQIDKDLNQN